MQEAREQNLVSISWNLVVFYFVLHFLLPPAHAHVEVRRQQFKRDTHIFHTATLVISNVPTLVTKAVKIASVAKIYATLEDIFSIQDFLLFPPSFYF